MDHWLLHLLNDFAWRHDTLGDALAFYGRISEPLFALGLAALFCAGIRRPPARLAALAAGASAALAVGCAFVLARLVDRPRPFVADPSRIHLLVKHAADPGFPSDHATAAFALATALLFHHRRAGAIALVAAALLAVSRVAIGVHYPTDVLAGALLGTLAAVAVERFTRPLARRIYEPG
jgi:undecaprenyl-diphosphatase